MVIIMLAEGMMAFFIVTALVAAATGDWPLAVLLGALSSATAPAATVDVLWEYKSRGPLTTTILGIVALDDSLALILYGFAMAFARAQLNGQPLSLATGLVGPLYVIGRTVGKISGAWMGSSWAKATRSVQNYLGFALFSQAGVAVGLALATAQAFDQSGPGAQQLGNTVVNVIAVTTFLVQIIGPPFVKFAISKAGEIPQPGAAHAQP